MAKLYIEEDGFPGLERDPGYTPLVVPRWLKDLVDVWIGTPDSMDHDFCPVLADIIRKRIEPSVLRDRLAEYFDKRGRDVAV